VGEVDIETLVTQIRDGQLILPEFQRGYIWTRTQVREYLGSLYKGYPTGSFLIWETPDPGKFRGNAAEPNMKYFRLILDGQQRLTSIYVLMEGKAPPYYESEELYFDIWFDLLGEEFAYYKTSDMKDKVNWISVTEFFKTGLSEFISPESGELADEVRLFRSQNLKKLAKLDKVRNYLYYLKTVTEREMDRVVTIFNFVNSKGTRLSKSDLALAYICSIWPEARDIFRGAQAKLSDQGFDFDLDFFTRCTSTVATGSALYEPLYKKSALEIQTAWKTTEPILNYVINVLRGDAYIDATSDLVSDAALIPIAVFLSRNGGTFKSERQKRDFLHWMFAALMWGRYSGSSESKLQADISALDEAQPTKTLRANLLAERGRIRVEPKDLDRAGVRSPFFKMAYIVARANGAMDWFNGVALYKKAAGKSFGLEDHHIFPQALLYKKLFQSSDRRDTAVVNQLANLAFLTKKSNLRIAAREPIKYLPDVVDKFPRALKAQFVPGRQALWTLDRFDDFLDERRRLLAGAINGFMDGLIEDEPETALSLKDYIAKGEGPQIEFKGSMRWDAKLSSVNKALEKSIAKTVAAFMNSAGGTLWIGVSDSGEVLGLEQDFKTLGERPDRDGYDQAFRNLLNSYLGPEYAPDVDLTFSEVESRTVASVHVERRKRPVFVHDGNVTEFYVRSGATSSPLNVKQANDYIATHFEMSN
jgi:hypothetical protein